MMPIQRVKDPPTPYGDGGGYRTIEGVLAGNVIDEAV
jgi:hypothetical protein